MIQKSARKQWLIVQVTEAAGIPAFRLISPQIKFQINSNVMNIIFTFTGYKVY